jgi:hypothetical protein
MLFLDAARAYAAAGDAPEARRCAKEALSLWPSFEASKSLDLTPARVREALAPQGRGLRRLPGAAKPAAAAPEAPAAALPSMFVELHAEALELAGEGEAARARFAEAQSLVEAEVARRHKAQEWAEAFSAALSMVRLSAHRGEPTALEASRRSFIEVAREAAREALTAEYFARGKDALPREAIEAAAEAARLLGDARAIAEVDAERALVLRRTAEILRELGDERTAAEAILSWEDSWPHLAKTPSLRRALLDDPASAHDLSGPLSSLASLAATHPTRLEVQEFADRHAALVAHARLRSR